MRQHQLASNKVGITTNAEDCSSMFNRKTSSTPISWGIKVARCWLGNITCHFDLYHWRHQRFQRGGLTSARTYCTCFFTGHLPSVLLTNTIAITLFIVVIHIHIHKPRRCFDPSPFFKPPLVVPTSACNPRYCRRRYTKGHQLI